MIPVHIIGHAGCGKTTLMVDLIGIIVTGEMSTVYLPKTPDTSPEKILETFYTNVESY